MAGRRQAGRSRGPFAQRVQVLRRAARLANALLLPHYLLLSSAISGSACTLLQRHASEAPGATRGGPQEKKICESKAVCIRHVHHVQMADGALAAPPRPRVSATCQQPISSRIVICGRTAAKDS